MARLTLLLTTPSLGMSAGAFRGPVQLLGANDFGDFDRPDALIARSGGHME